MMAADLVSGSEFLRDAACKFFKDRYQVLNISTGTELHKDLGWMPSFRFVFQDHIHVFVELSEDSPYPRIVKIRHPDVLQFPEPIAVYCVCPEQVALDPANQKEIRDMEDHGYGLVVVTSEGDARRRFAAVPLTQVISKADYTAQLQGLSPRQKEKVASAYEDYNSKPSTGVTALTEIVEGLALQAGKEASKKNWITDAEAKGGTAVILKAMFESKQCQNARADIGGLLGYFSNYRHMNHHWPKNKKRAQQRYTECRVAFLEGINQIRRFRRSMKAIRLSGNLPNG